MVLAKERRESPLAAFLRAEVPDWDDEVVVRARYKAFTGQRTDWENRLQFWKSLVVKSARHLGLVAIDPTQVSEDLNLYLTNSVVPTFRLRRCLIARLPIK